MVSEVIHSNISVTGLLIQRTQNNRSINFDFFGGGLRRTRAESGPCQAQAPSLAHGDSGAPFDPGQC